jgi:GTP-binding protein
MASRIEAARRSLPVVVIVGRPNVGKSTLFNRVVRARRAIVDDAPGVTRDRVVARAEHGGRAFVCVDTGGFLADTPRDAAALAAQVRAQALAAVDEADVVVCVLDGAAGLAPADRDTVRLLARARKPVLFAVNKIDTAAREPQAAEFYAAGVDRVFPVSAAHNRGVDELLDEVVARLPAVPAAEPDDGGTRLALLGRPNVGKSSVLNRLLGTERALVAPEAGTTRDHIDTPVRIDGRPFVLIDTAGVRRRGRGSDLLERHGAVRALGMIERSDLVCFVLDASEGMTDQDARLVGRAWEAGRGVILLANKWDLVAGPRRDVRTFRRALAAAHPGFATLPLLCVSARTGEGLEGLFGVLGQVERSYRATLGTSKLNQVLRAAVEAHTPPSPDGRPVRLFYVTQTGSGPPAVTVFASAPARVPAAYARFLRTRFVEAFGLVGVPLRVRFRARRQAPVSAPHGSGARARRSSRPRSAGARARPR